MAAVAVATLTYAGTNGTDTAASGSNAPTTAHTETSLSSQISGTGAGTSFTFDAGAIDLTGVLDDGTDVLWTAGTAGERHLFRIVSYTGGKAACTALVVNEAIGGTTITAANWAIGGKRKTMVNDTSRYDWIDMAAGWTFLFDNETQTITSAPIAPTTGDVATGPNTFASSDPASFQPVFSQANAASIFQIATSTENIVIDSLDLTMTATTLAGLPVNVTSALAVCVKNCIIRPGTYHSVQITSVNGPIVIDNNEIIGSANCDGGVKVTSGRSHVRITRNSIHGITSGPALEDTDTTDTRDWTVDHNVLYGCAVGVQLGTVVDATNVSHTIEYNTIYNMSAAGIDVNGDSPGTSYQFNLVGNVISDCGTYGVDAPSGFENNIWRNSNNYYYNNTSGNWNNPPGGGTASFGTDDDNTETDPLFTNVGAGTEDFTPASGSPLIDAGPVVPTA